MGYILVDDFTGNRSQFVPVSNPFYTIKYRDWDWDFNRKNKDRQLYIEITTSNLLDNNNYIDIILNQEYFIEYEDVFGKKQKYDYFLFSWKEEIINLDNAPIIYSPESIGNSDFSLGFYYNDVLLYEFIIFHNFPMNDDYRRHLIDLSVFQNLEIKKFNRIKLKVLSNKGKLSKFYLGDMFMFQDTIEQNLLLSISSKLNNKYYEKCGTLLQCENDFIIVKDLVDVKEGYCIALAKSEKELVNFNNKVLGYNYFEYENKLEDVEIHQIKSVEVITESVYKLKFFDNFDGKNIRNQYPSGIDIYFVVPVVFDDFVDETYKMPCILLTYNFPTVNKISFRKEGLFNIIIIRNNISDTFDFNFGYMKNLNCLKLEITISIFSDNLDLSTKLGNMVRNVVDVLGSLEIFDLTFNIEDIIYRTVGSIGEYSQVSEFVISILCFEGFQKIEYSPQKFQSLDILDFGIIG